MPSRFNWWESDVPACVCGGERPAAFLAQRFLTVVVVARNLRLVPCGGALAAPRLSVIAPHVYTRDESSDGEDSAPIKVFRRVAPSRGRWAFA